MPLNGHVTSAVFDRQGNPVDRIGRQHVDRNGRIEIFDDESYRVPWIDIPDSLYFGEPIPPDPEEQEQGALALAHAALERVVKAARRVIWAACADFDGGDPIPSRTNHALAELDECLTNLDTIAEVPPDRELDAAMAEPMPARLPYRVAMANGTLAARQEDDQ